MTIGLNSVYKCRIGYRCTVQYIQLDKYCLRKFLWKKQVPAATFRRLFEDLPRPAPLPPSPYPNCHPYAVREEEPLPAVVEVDSGPLITYWDHDYTVPIPGVGSGPPAWWPYSPVDNESPCPSPSASPPPLPPTSGPSPPSSTTPMPPPGPSSPAPPPALPTAPPHKALKTYLGRTRRRISPPSGRSPLSVLPSPARLPARRKKEEKRCGRWNYLKCMSFFQFSGSRCLACKSPKCMDCHTCLNPQKKQGCLRRPSCCGEESDNDSDTSPLQFPPYYDYNPFGSLRFDMVFQKLSPRKSMIDN